MYLITGYATGCWGGGVGVGRLMMMEPCLLSALDPIYFKSLRSTVMYMLLLFFRGHCKLMFVV